ncbi:MAG: hypothetical protein KGM44_03690 [bacterium]|nr:hypothetical protein [bacterium]
MRPYEDDLDRMLSALPLSEPPADLRARILAATVRRSIPVPVPVVAWWETTIYGMLFALVVWSALAVARAPHAGVYVSAAVNWIVSALPPGALAWTAAGAVVVIWHVLLTERGRRLSA